MKKLKAGQEITKTSAKADQGVYEKTQKRVRGDMKNAKVGQKI